MKLSRRATGGVKRLSTYEENAIYFALERGEPVGDKSVVRSGALVSKRLGSSELSGLVVRVSE